MGLKGMGQMNSELKLLLETVLNDALQPIKEDIQALKGDFQSLKEDVQVLKGDFRSLKEDIQSLKEDVLSLKSGQSELYQLVRVIHDRQEESDARIEALSMDVHQVIGELTSLKQGRNDRIRYWNHWLFVPLNKKLNFANLNVLSD
jgi:chromosome segregation ATPase